MAFRFGRVRFRWRFWALVLLTVAGVGGYAYAASAAPSGAEAAKARRTRFRLWMKALCPQWFRGGAAVHGWYAFEAGEWSRPEGTLARRLVLLVHGVDESGHLWRSMAPALAEAGFPVCKLRYPNDQPIHDSTVFFFEHLQSLRACGVEEAVIVAHSMGGLVSRDLLTDPELDYAGQVAAGSVPRIKSLIMLGTPNAGSELARIRILGEFRDQWTRFLQGEGHLLSGLADGVGEAKFDLLPDSPFLKRLNARPHPASVSYTVIAGIASPLTRRRLDETIAEWRRAGFFESVPALVRLQQDLEELTEGIGDGAVSLASTRLPGVADHVTVAGNHLSMLRNMTPWSKRVPPAVPIVVDRVRGAW